MDQYCIQKLGHWATFISFVLRLFPPPSFWSLAILTLTLSVFAYYMQAIKNWRQEWPGNEATTLSISQRGRISYRTWLLCHWFLTIKSTLKLHLLSMLIFTWGSIRIQFLIVTDLFTSLQTLEYVCALTVPPQLKLAVPWSIKPPISHSHFSGGGLAW